MEMKIAQKELFPIREAKALRHRNRRNYNQYFTPEFAVEKALSLISEIEAKNIIDPAVGAGVFLGVAKRKWEDSRLFGIDIDKTVIGELQKSNLTNAYLFHGDALLQRTWQNPEIREIIEKGGFDFVIGNPPFSSWFNRIDSSEILSSYKLAYRNGNLMRSQSIEVLFLEIFIRLVKDSGYTIIVLPDGILSNPQYKYVREFILKETMVKHIISLPRNVFKDTSAKTSILILQKRKEMSYLVKVNDLGKSGKLNNTIEVPQNDLINRMDYCYYYKLSKGSLQELINKGLSFKPLKDFVVYCKTGKTLYGKDRQFSNKGVRFLHATNITDIGINYKKDEKFIDPMSNMYFPSAYAKVGDMVFVRVGVGCAGRVAIINSEEDEGIATDYLHIIRVKGIDPYFLTVYLKTKYGREAIELLKHGVGTISINKTDVLSIPIPVVLKEFQEEVSESYRNILRDYRKNLQDDHGEIKTKTESLIHYVEEEIINGGRYVEM